MTSSLKHRPTVGLGLRADDGMVAMNEMTQASAYVACIVLSTKREECRVMLLPEVTMRTDDSDKKNAHA